MLQNNTSGKAKNATILHKYGHILFAVISRHEPITLSVPPTFQGNLRKQRILQQSSRIITCRVAYYNLFLSWRHHKLKKTEKNHSLFHFIDKWSANLLTGRLTYAAGVHSLSAYTMRWINVGAMLYHHLQR